jgi:hypothetical protein
MRAVLKEKKTVLVIFVLLFFTADIYADEWANAWWTGQVSSQWNNAGNWYIANEKNRVPNAGDIVDLNHGETAYPLIIDDNNVGLSKAACNNLWMPDWQETPEPFHLLMTGGELEIVKDFIIGRTNINGEREWVDTGILELTGGTITIGEKLSVGGRGNDYGCEIGGIGTINMTGGIISCGSLLIPEGQTEAKGTVHLDGGFIYADTLSMKAGDPNGVMYIIDGMLILSGDQVAHVESYIAAELILLGTEDPEYALEVVYDPETDSTEVSANPDIEQPGSEEWANVWWTGGAGNTLWNEPNNWSVHDELSRVPKATDTLDLNWGDAAYLPVIDSNNLGENKAICRNLWMPDWQETEEPFHLLMIAGELEILKDFIIGRTNIGGEETYVDTGILELTGGTITIGQKLSVGGRGNDYGCDIGGTGTINMTGGTISCGSLLIPEGETEAQGTVNLDGGTIYASTFVMNPGAENGIMYLTDGKLVLSGDQAAHVDGYIAAGWIASGKPEDPNYAPEAVYDPISNTTTVLANPELIVTEEWANVWWKGDDPSSQAVSSNWEEAANWFVMNEDDRAPRDYDTVDLNWGGALFSPVIDSNNVGEDRAVCKNLWMPDWQSTEEPFHLLMVAGELEIVKDFIIGRTNLNGSAAWVDTGIFELTGGTVTIGGKLSVGGRGNDYGCEIGGIGTVNMTGGTISCGSLLIPEGQTEAQGTVNLAGGIVYADTLVMNPGAENGIMYISDGKLVLAGDQTAHVESYIDAGWINAGTPDDPNYVLDITYHSDTDTTEVFAGCCGCGPDLYRDCFVDIEDLRIFVDNWSEAGLNVADFNGDGKVDLQDYAILASRWLAVPVNP